VPPKPPLDRHSDAWITTFGHGCGSASKNCAPSSNAPGSDVEQTRGRIAELRDLDRLIDPADAIDGSSGAYFPTRNSAT
jgi:hypothetical protein